MLSLFLKTTYLDAPEPWGVMFQDPASPLARGIHDLHHDVCFFMIVIMLFVFWMLGRSIWFFRESVNPIPSRTIHGSTLEIVWTVVPSIILLVLACPSFALLYSMDEIVHPAVTLKVTGNQWYWSYEYSDYMNESISFDSYMIPEDDLVEGDLRLLEVDNRVVLPVDTHIRFLITARDVIHCWAVPSIGIKCDGIPGRLNQISGFIDREGLFYGQCSEICGAHHGYMPIAVEAVSIADYEAWIINQLETDFSTPEVEQSQVEVVENNSDTVTDFQAEIDAVKSEMAQVKSDVNELRSLLEAQAASIEKLEKKA